jgi:hypothetical protein
MPLLIYILSLLPVPVLAWIAIVMYRRKQHVVYLAFWLYICFQFIRVMAEDVVFRISYPLFFYSYWISEACTVIFGLLLLRGIFTTVLRNYSSLTRVRQIGYEVALVTFWTLGATLVLARPFGHTLSQMITRAEEVVSFTAVGMFVFVIGASMVLGIRWRAKLCGIAAGLGLLGTVDLLVYAAISRKMLSFGTAGWIETIGFDLAVGIFALYFLRRTTEPPPPHPPSMRIDLLHWAQNARGAILK